MYVCMCVSAVKVLFFGLKIKRIKIIFMLSTNQKENVEWSVTFNSKLIVKLQKYYP